MIACSLKRSAGLRWSTWLNLSLFFILSTMFGNVGSALAQCSLVLTSPAEGAVMTVSPTITVTGYAEASVDPGPAYVEVRLNGARVWGMSGTFTQFEQFLRSGAVRLTLAQGQNFIEVDGGAANCSAYDSISLSYLPGADTGPDSDLGPSPQKGDGPPEDQKGAGEPIDIATGNVYLQQTDFITTRAGIPTQLSLQFKRTYNSRTSYKGPLGRGWTHNYDVALVLGDLLGVRRENGQVIYFQDNGDGTYAAPEGVDNTLEKEGSQFKFTTVEHFTYTFDGEGKLLQISDLHGNKLQMQYTKSKLVSVADDFGATVAFVYTDNFITKVIDPAGRTYLYGYSDDQNPNLASVTYPSDGEPMVRQYLYEDSNDAHNLTGVVDENQDRWVTYGYDGQDRAVLSEMAGGVMQINVDYSGGDRIAVTNSLGRRTIFSREIKDGRAYITQIEPDAAQGGLCSSCAAYGSYEYDADHRLARIIDANGNQTRFTYDSRGNVLSIIEAEGTPLERSTINTYHSNFNKPETVTVASVDTPGQIKVTSFTYDEITGDLLNSVESGYSNQGLLTRTISYAYNPRGQLTLIDGPRNDTADTLQYTYYPNEESYGSSRGRLHEAISPVGTTTYLDYDAAGRPLRVSDENNVETIYTYHPRGWLTSKTTDGRTYQYDYDLVGNRTSITDPELRTSFLGYDAAHRLVELVDPAGNRIGYTLDTEGNRRKEEIFTSDNLLVKTVSMDYDDQNRLELVTFPDNAMQQFGYDANGNLTSIVDENENLTSYTYDALNRISTAVQHLADEPVTTIYTFDTHDNLRQIQDSEGYVTENRFDDFNQMVEKVSAVTGITVYQYDQAGNLTAKTDAAGIHVGYTFDGANRLLTVDYPDDPDVSFTYDEGLYGKGRLTGMQDGGGSYALTYDALGNLILEQKTIAGVVYTTGYRYDRADVLNGVFYPSGAGVEYELDAAGRIMRVLLNRITETLVLADNIAYLPFGPMQRLTFGNGAVLDRDFNLRYQLAAMTAGGILNLGYEYDPAGNVTAITDNLNPLKSQSFGYDDLYRLTEAVGNYGSAGFTYDRVGNRLTKTTNGQTEQYLYHPQTGRLTEITSADPKLFSYDGNGNTKTAGQLEFAYNQNNQPAKAMVAAQSVADYEYDGLGRRTRKYTPDSATVYHYDLSGNLIGESNESGDFLKEYIYIDQVRLAAVASGSDPLCLADLVKDGVVDENDLAEFSAKFGLAACGDGGSCPADFDGDTDTDGRDLAQLLSEFGRSNCPIDRVYFFHTDHLGTPLAITDENGQTVWAAAYMPFGDAIVSVDDVGNNLRFPGQYSDEETGLHYNYHRYYDPKTGRYLTADPIGLLGGINLYLYVGSNPINWIDLFGLVEGSPSNILIRQRIDQIARGYEGSTLWAISARKDDFPPGSNKCNKFVYDVTREASAIAIIKGRQPLAAEWADPNTVIANWRLLEPGEVPQPGDVAAYKLSGGGSRYSGHSGIIIKYEPGLFRRILQKIFPSLKKTTTNISAHAESVYPVPGQFENNPNTRYRRYIGD